MSFFVPCRGHPTFRGLLEAGGREGRIDSREILSICIVYTSVLVGIYSNDVCERESVCLTRIW